MMVTYQRASVYTGSRQTMTALLRSSRRDVDDVRDDEEDMRVVFPVFGCSSRVPENQMYLQAMMTAN
jgi:hypothetical protein